MSAPRKKPVQPASEKQPLDEHLAPDEQSQPDDEQALDDEPEAEQPAEAPEPSEEVRKFVALIHLNNHKAARGKQFEPAHGVTLQFGYNGLLRLRGHNHVHIATVDELAEMGDQALYDAVMASGEEPMNDTNHEFQAYSKLMDNIDATIENGRKVANEDIHGRALAIAMINLQHVRTWAQESLSSVAQKMSEEYKDAQKNEQH